MTKRDKDQPSARKITVLRQLREKAGLSREQLVARLDNQIALRTLQRWETLGREPALTRSQWLDLCAILGVRWEDLPRNLSDYYDPTCHEDRNWVDVVVESELAQSMATVSST